MGRDELEGRSGQLGASRQNNTQNWTFPKNFPTDIYC